MAAAAARRRPAAMPAVTVPSARRAALLALAALLRVAQTTTPPAAARPQPPSCVDTKPCPFGAPCKGGYCCTPYDASSASPLCTACAEIGGMCTACAPGALAKHLGNGALTCVEMVFATRSSSATSINSSQEPAAQNASRTATPAPRVAAVPPAGGGTGDSAEAEAWGRPAEECASVDDCPDARDIIISAGVLAVRRLTITGIVPYPTNPNACQRLLTAGIPGHVRTIGTAAFFGCTSLTTVHMAQHGQLQAIEMDAFQQCRSLRSVVRVASRVGGAVVVVVVKGGAARPGRAPGAGLLAAGRTHNQLARARARSRRRPRCAAPPPPGDGVGR